MAGEDSVAAELARLRAREREATEAECYTIVERKKELKQMMRDGVTTLPPTPSPASQQVLDSLQSLGNGLGNAGSFPSFPGFTFKMPTEEDASLFAGTVSFSSLTGFCSGVVLKKIGRAASFSFGVIFLGLTAGQQSGYIDVNWEKIEKDTMGQLDFNKDGKTDASDAQVALKRFVSYATDQNSAVAGASFTTGLLLGLRHG